MALSNDQQRRERQEIWVDVTEAIKSGDMNAGAIKLQDYFERLETDIKSEHASAEQHADRAALAQRGQRTLTSKEQTFYNSLISTLDSKNYRQEIANADLTIPETVINSVFDDIRQERPLLNEVDFQVYPGNVRVIIDMSGNNKAVWGKLCDDIVEELELELDEWDIGKHKLSAFIFVCKPMLQLGAEWLDRYVREHLRDALEAGLEEGIVKGTGVDQPVGMIRDLTAAYNPSTGYVEQTATPLASFGVQDLGPLMQELATTENGRSRSTGQVFLAYNPVDYYTLLHPATHILTPTGYISVAPFGIKFVESTEVEVGKAILGISGKYLSTIATGVEGQIEYSDHYKFLEDDRTYIVKLLGNGIPKDKVSFKVLDISNVEPFITATTGGDPIDPGE